jgi:hypothetical protein
MHGRASGGVLRKLRLLNDFGGFSSLTLRLLLNFQPGLTKAEGEDKVESMNKGNTKRGIFLKGVLAMVAISYKT